MSGEKQKKSKPKKQARTQVEASGEGTIGIGGNVDKSVLATDNAGNVCR